VSVSPPWSLLWTPLAIDDLAKLDDPMVSRIRSAVQRFANSHEGDVRKLKGLHERWRLRVGDWRVLFRFDRDRQAIIILRVLNRRDAYRA